MDISVLSCDRILEVGMITYMIDLALNTSARTITVVAECERFIHLEIPDIRTMDFYITHEIGGLSDYAKKDSFGFYFPQHDTVDITYSNGNVSNLAFKLLDITVSELTILRTGNTILSLTQTDKGEFPITNTFTFIRDSNDYIRSIIKS